MPRYLGRNRIGYCQRSGFKVRYRDLVPDGETGQLVEKGWEDDEHPQKYLPAIGDQGARTIPGVLANIEPEEEIEVNPILLDDTGTLNEE
jgi:hypothetical protein